MSFIRILFLLAATVYFVQGSFFQETETLNECEQTHRCPMAESDYDLENASVHFYSRAFKNGR